MVEQNCMTCRWYDRWVGMCFCGDAEQCANYPPEPETTRCRMWEARGQ